MQITPYRLGSRYRPGLARIEKIAAQAAQLVQGKLREQIGHVEIVVTDTPNYGDSILAAERRILGTRTQSRYSLPPSLAHTTLIPNGTLIVFDAQATPARDIDATVVHELVHAAQFGRPGVRNSVLAGIRNNHDIKRVGWFAAHRENRKVAAHEREAIRLESLARKIR